LSCPPLARLGQGRSSGHAHFWSLFHPVGKNMNESNNVYNQINLNSSQQTKQHSLKEN
jgi:hypothetical protein